MQINGIWGTSSFGEPGPKFPGYSECVDTLAGIRYRLITAYDVVNAHYIVGAFEVDPDTVWVVRGQPVARVGYTEALVGESPSIADQRLFLAILRTFRHDPTWRRKGR